MEATCRSGSGTSHERVTNSLWAKYAAGRGSRAEFALRDSHEFALRDSQGPGRRRGCQAGQGVRSDHRHGHHRRHPAVGPDIPVGHSSLLPASSTSGRRSHREHRLPGDPLDPPGPDDEDLATELDRRHGPGTRVASVQERGGAGSRRWPVPSPPPAWQHPTAPSSLRESRWSGSAVAADQFRLVGEGLQKVGCLTERHVGVVEPGRHGFADQPVVALGEVGRLPDAAGNGEREELTLCGSWPSTAVW